MNPDVPDADGCFEYYDSDYPWPEELDGRPELQGVAFRQGILDDIGFYRLLAAQLGDPVLEIACGTGRIAIPLARRGHRVTGIDVAPAMLDGLRRRLAAEPVDVASRIAVDRQDVQTLDLPVRDYTLAIWAFNGLMLVPDFDAQVEALARVRDHLAPGGRLALDVFNPLMMPLGAQVLPEASFARINRHTGNPYTKFALAAPMDAGQVQYIHGWYDEILPGGAVKRTPFAFHWRMIFRYELEMMMEKAGFRVERLDGGFQGEPFQTTSPKMVVVAQKA